MTQRVKRLKALPAFTDNSISSYEESRQKRTQLGEAFGTKKAQSRIRADERNKVNAVAQEKSRDHLMDSIGKAHERMPMICGVISVPFRVDISADDGSSHLFQRLPNND
jgi:DNA-directed RNA polymerase I subunit RPA49